MTTRGLLISVLTAFGLLCGCSSDPQPIAAIQAHGPGNGSPPTSFELVAGVQDIMALEIDPSADAIWESVSVVSTRNGIVENQPKSAEEWEALRARALVMIEASNLLRMKGRRILREGAAKLDDHGTPGNLSAEQAQQAVDANYDEFSSYAAVLGAVGSKMLAAITAHDPQALLDTGAALDQACENCHLKFWYPGQKIPRLPDEAHEIR